MHAILRKTNNLPVPITHTNAPAEQRPGSMVQHVLRGLVGVQDSRAADVARQHHVDVGRLLEDGAHHAQVVDLVRQLGLEVAVAQAGLPAVLARVPLAARDFFLVCEARQVRGGRAFLLGQLL